MNQAMVPGTVRVGDALPEVHFGPISRATLALYAGASGDHNEVHIDIDFAKKAGLPDVFAQGMLVFGVLSRAVTQWAGSERLRSCEARFISITHVHETIVCRGTVAECFEEDGEPRARIQLVAATQEGRQTLLGEAVVALA